MISAMTLIFDILNFPFLNGDVLRSTFYGVYISQLIRFARVSGHVTDFNARNKILTGKLLKTVLKFYRRHYELLQKLKVISFAAGPFGTRFYGALVYKLRKIVGRLNNLNKTCL